MHAARRPGTFVRSLLPAPRAPAALVLLGEVVDWTVVAIGGVMVAIVFVNVVFHLFGLDNAWTIELSEFLMVWVTFLGGAAAARRHAHMTISELVDKLGPGLRRAADGAIQLLTATILVLLGWFGMGIVNASWGNELTVLRVPMALQYLALPAGAVAMLAFVGWDLWQISRGVPRETRYALAHADVTSARAERAVHDDVATPMTRRPAASAASDPRRREDD